jgi:hypothetical protein
MKGDSLIIQGRVIQDTFQRLIVLQLFFVTPSQKGGHYTVIRDYYVLCGPIFKIY